MGELNSRQVAEKLGTNPRVLRKFLRWRAGKDGTKADLPGQGGRYALDEGDLPELEKRFKAWSKDKPDLPKGVEPQKVAPDGSVEKKPRKRRAKPKSGRGLERQLAREHDKNGGLAARTRFSIAERKFLAAEGLDVDKTTREELDAILTHTPGAQSKLDDIDAYLEDHEPGEGAGEDPELDDLDDLLDGLDDSDLET